MEPIETGTEEELQADIVHHLPTVLLEIMYEYARSAFPSYATKWNIGEHDVLQFINIDKKLVFVDVEERETLSDPDMYVLDCETGSMNTWPFPRCYGLAHHGLSGTVFISSVSVSADEKNSIFLATDEGILKKSELVGEIFGQLKPCSEGVVCLSRQMGTIIVFNTEGIKLRSFDVYVRNEYEQESGDICFSVGWVDGEEFVFIGTRLFGEGSVVNMYDLTTGLVRRFWKLEGLLLTLEFYSQYELLYSIVQNNEEYEEHEERQWLWYAWDPRSDAIVEEHLKERTTFSQCGISVPYSGTPLLYCGTDCRCYLSLSGIIYGLEWL